MPRRSRWLAAALGCFVAGAAVWGGEPDQLPPLDAAAAADVSYRHDVVPVLKRHCWGCHSGSDPRGGLSMDSAAELAKGGDSGPAWTAGQPDESLLVQMLIGAREPSMPKDKPRLPAAKIHLLRQWILAGARDDSTPDDDEPPVAIPDLYRFAPSVTSLSFSPDGRLLAAACQSEIVVLDAAGDAPPRRLPTESELVTYVDFSPDGATLAGAGGSPTRYGEIRFYQSADWSLRSSRRLGRDTFFRGGFSPDGTQVALGATEGAIWVVPVAAEVEPRRFELHSDWVSDVTYSPDGRLLISGGRDKSVKVSFADSGKLIRSIAANDELVSAVAAAENLALAAGRDMVPASYDLALALADTEFAGPIGNETKPVDKTGQYVKKFEAQPGEILDCATNAARTLLAVAGSSAEVRVYNIADQVRVAAITGLPAPVYSVALSPDGTRLAAGGQSGEISLYELPGGQLVRRLVPVPLEVAAK